MKDFTDTPLLRVRGDRYDSLNRGNEIRVGSRAVLAACDAPAEGDPVVISPQAGSMQLTAVLGKYEDSNHSWTILPATGG